jgi:ATP-binding cassette subfamily B (MDR/TAP) protein 1
MQLVRDTCRAAFAHDFVDQLPNQYLTKIGEGARMLSGGQRQRIAIARSIISNPPVLLLDEATSALDPNAEKIVQDALDNVSKSRTTLTIAHKLSTVQKADNIAVISEGAVIEQGTHRELIDGNGAYARLVRAQSLEQAVKMDSSHLHGDKEYETDANLEEPSQHGLSRLETNVSSAQLHETGPPKLLNEGMGYSLLKCLFLLITEHRQLWPAYFALGLLSIFAGGTWPALAVLFSHTFSVFQLQGGAAVRAASFWALMFFVVALGNLLIYFSIGVVCNIVAQKVTRKYRLQTFNNTIKQDIAFFDQEANSTGATVSRLSTCSTDLHELLGFNAGVILNNLVTVVACSILGIAYGWKLGLACTFGALPPVLLSGYARIRLETKLDNDTAKRFANSATLATEAVASIRTVASLTLEATIIGQYKERLSFIASRSIKVLLSTMVWYAFTQSVNFLAMALGFW